VAKIVIIINISKKNTNMGFCRYCVNHVKY